MHAQNKTKKKDEKTKIKKKNSQNANCSLKYAILIAFFLLLLKNYN